jgi:hypothetical protein
MRIIWLPLVLVMSLAPAASGQQIYWGVIGGTNLTPDFPRYDMSAPEDIYGNPAYHFQHLPGPRSFILGGLLEVRLTNSLAIEADILHRPLPDLIVNTSFPAGSPSVTTTYRFVANTWEFPVMLKWNLPPPLAWGRIRPFLEGGPAFRTSQDDVAVLPSQFGITAGMGVAIHFGKLRLAPTIRYTRWEKETYDYPTKPDQLEFLTSLAWGTSADPLHAVHAAAGHRLSLGVLGGLSLIGEFYYPGTGVRERVGYLAGASGQLELREGLALEIDAIYKPLHTSFNQGQGFSVLTWDFPVLAKYHLAKLGQAPFVEAGPSFRASGNLNGYNPSHFGVTAGGGAEIRKGGVLLSTALRYTRWLKDASPNSSLLSGDHSDYPRTNGNAVELIFGVGY